MDLDEVCNHDWTWIRDWYGDPGVINGIQDCSYWSCRKCGEENYTHPRPKRKFMDTDYGSE